MKKDDFLPPPKGWTMKQLLKDGIVVDEKWVQYFPGSCGRLPSQGVYTVLAIMLHTNVKDWNKANLTYLLNFFFNRITPEGQRRTIGYVRNGDAEDWIDLLVKDADRRKRQAIKSLKEKPTLVEQVLADIKKETV